MGAGLVLGGGRTKSHGNPTLTHSSNNDVVEAVEKRGHRMSKPDLASENIYSIMKQCWITDPEHRPSFADIYQVRREVESGAWRAELTPAFASPHGSCWKRTSPTIRKNSASSSTDTAHFSAEVIASLFVFVEFEGRACVAPSPPTQAFSE